MTDFSYDAWPTGEPYQWGEAGRGGTIYDSMDFHVDLGCGRIKKGRIGIDRYPAPGVNIVADLNTLRIFGVAPEPGRDAVEQIGGGLTRFHCDNFGVGAPYLDYYEGGELLDITRGAGKLPFYDGEIESVISHHFLEHLGDGFLPLIDEVYRVLKPGGIFYAITPLFPSASAVSDADHKRYFMETTWDAFCGTPGDTPQNCWLASFSVPYTKARFSKLHQDMTAPTPPHLQWSKEDAREIRVVLRAEK